MLEFYFCSLLYKHHFYGNKERERKKGLFRAEKKNMKKQQRGNNIDVVQKLLITIVNDCMVEVIVILVHNF